ncbi:MAG: hypothetical protein AB7O96_11370 [Pseudobdellovibrionaceae bacterium]
MRIRLIYPLLFVLSACGQQIDDFVNSGSKHTVAPVESPPGISTSKAIKYSPGAVVANGPQVSAKYGVTHTRFLVTSSGVDARVSISQNRVQ